MPKTGGFHQKFRPVPTVKLLGIMSRNRCWFTTSHTTYSWSCWRMVPVVADVISPLRPKRWNRMFWNLGIHHMCKRGFVCFSLVTPHLKDDDFTKRSKYKFETSRLDLAFLLAPKMVVLVFQPSFFKSWQSKWDVKPMFLVANSMKNDFIIYLAPIKLGRCCQWGETGSFIACVPPSPLPPHFHCMQLNTRKRKEVRLATRILVSFYHCEWRLCR